MICRPFLAAGILTVTASGVLAAGEARIIDLTAPAVVLATADLANDGTTEVVAGLEDGSIVVFSPRSASSTPLLRLDSGGRPTAITIERSGRLPHILVVTRDPGQLVVFSPDGQGTFIRTIFPVRGTPSSVTVRKSSERHMKNAMTVATHQNGRDGLEIFESCYGCPCGSTFHPAGEGSALVHALDLDGDGVEEIAATSSTSAEITIFKRTLEETYTPTQILTLDTEPLTSAAMTLGDAAALAVILRHEPDQLLIAANRDGELRIATRVPLAFAARGLAASGADLYVFGASNEVFRLRADSEELTSHIAASAAAAPDAIAVFGDQDGRMLVISYGDRIQLLPVE